MHDCSLTITVDNGILHSSHKQKIIVFSHNLSGTHFVS